MVIEKLIEERKKRQYSCGFMALKLKISKTYYWQLENGKRRLLYEMAFKIANIFNLTPDDLFYDYFQKIKDVNKNGM